LRDTEIAFAKEMEVKKQILLKCPGNRISIIKKFPTGWKIYGDMNCDLPDYSFEN